MQTFHWLDASQGVGTVVAVVVVAAAAATGYSFASPPVADERDLHDEAKGSCRATEAGQMEATGEFGFEQQVRVLEAQRMVRRMGKS